MLSLDRYLSEVIQIIEGKAELHVFEIWIAIVSLESNHEPKFLADDTEVIVAVPL